MDLEFTPEFNEGLRILTETKSPLFLTGKAGTGKSTLLHYAKTHSTKNIIVLAPTGVAALNVQGQTIHSFFNFGINITYEKVRAHSKVDLFNRIDTIVIDEISMVRSDLLDCIDACLRMTRGIHTPFGGVQMVFIGDLYQLPPVVRKNEEQIFKILYHSQYFFSARSFKKLSLEFVELKKIYRQKEDMEFIDLLNDVRMNTLTPRALARLNSKVNAKYQASSEDAYIYLTTTNDRAGEVNTAYLASIDAPPVLSVADVIGEVPKDYYATDVKLELKAGAQVMMLNNDIQGRWVNGSVGRIIDFLRLSSGEKNPIVEIDGSRYCIEKYDWKIIEFTLNEKENRIESEEIGIFRQYPLSICKAITIHKSQGKTFEKVFLDLHWGAFSHGQLYVALSRCTTLEGLMLKKPIRQADILVDDAVEIFMTLLREYI